MVFNPAVWLAADCTGGADAPLARGLER